MKNNASICIIGGYDALARSYFKELKKNHKSVIFINLQSNIYHDNNLYNFKIFELKRILDLLKLKNISEIVFLGKIHRPNLSDFKSDGIVDKYIPLLLKAYKKGDGFVLSSVIKIFKEYKYNAISPLKYSDKFTLNHQSIDYNDSKKSQIDIKKSIDLLNELSKFDNAQSSVCVNGYILAIEAAEGTDALLKRVFEIRKKLNQLSIKSGYLTKKLKNNQSKLIDLPVIGPKTIKLIKKANLEGLAIDCKNTLVYRKQEVLKLISEFDLKIYNIV